MEAILIHKENNDLVDEINNSKFPTSNLRKLFELEARSREQIKLKTQKNRKLKLDDDDDSNIDQGNMVKWKILRDQRVIMKIMKRND